MRIKLLILGLFVYTASFGQAGRSIYVPGTSGTEPGNDSLRYTWYKFQYGNRQPRYWADSVLVTPKDTIFSKSGLAVIGTTLYVGNGTQWTASAGGGGTGGIDSVVYRSGQLCQWKAGAPTCYSIPTVGTSYGVDSIVVTPGGMLIVYSGGSGTTYTLSNFYDSTHLNADSSYLRYFNNGNLIDSSYQLRSPLFARGSVSIKDTASGGVRGFVLIGAATGGTGGRVDSVHASLDSSYLVINYTDGSKDSIPFYGNQGTVTSIGLTSSDITVGGATSPITSAGTYTLTLPTVNANVGTFSNSTVTVNAKGQVTAVVQGSAGGTGTVTSVATGLGLTGGPITSTGTAALDTASAVVLSRPRAAATYEPIITVLPIAKGGTNNGSLSVTAGTIYYGDGTKLIGLAPGTAAQHLTGGTTPSWKDTAVAGGGSGPSWSLTGNTGVTAGSTFLGTTDLKSLVFKTNGVIRGKIDSLGNVFFDSTYFGKGTGPSYRKSSLAAGDSALGRNTTGVRNTAIGDTVLQANTTGSDNTGVGAYSLQNNTTGVGNTAAGVESLFTNSVGSYGVAFGYRTLKFNTGDQNTAIGATALGANTTGVNGTAIGFGALVLNTTGIQNTSIGAYSLNANVSGAGNTSVGFENLKANTATGNTSVGLQGMKANTSGTSNTGVGYQHLLANISGQDNVAVGLSSVSTNTTGSFNTGVGDYSLGLNNGGQNTAVGFTALYSNSGGSRNSGFSYNAGRYLLDGTTANSTPNNSMYFGNDTRSFAASQTNENVFGVDALGLGTNTFSFGNSSTITHAFYGNLTFRRTGDKVIIPTGTNASVGTATLIAGTVTVSTTAVATASKIFVTVTTPGGTQGILSVPTIVNATSFTINSTSVADISVVNWWIIN